MPAVNPGTVLPTAPPQYDATDQREMRRLLEDALRRSQSFASLTSVPSNVSQLANLTGEADTVPYFTGLSAMALASLTPYARTILACANASDARDALGLGELAVRDFVTETEIQLDDNTTNDVDTFRHGFVPKLSGDPGDVLSGVGTWVPVASGTPALGTFPSISGLQLRLSAELSTMTLNTDNLVAQLNDLSGTWGSNFTAATTARLRYKPGVIGGRPGIVFDGMNNILKATATKTLAQPFSVVIVFARWRAASGNQDMYRDNSNGPVFFRSGGNSWGMFAGGTATSTALYTQNIQGELPNSGESALAVAMQVWNGASSIMSNNGVEVTVNPSTTGISGTFGVGGNSTGTFAPFVFYEMLIFNSALGPTDRAALNTYYANALGIRL